MISMTWNFPGHSQTFSYPKTIKVLIEFTSPLANAHQGMPRLQKSTYQFTQDDIYTKSGMNIYGSHPFTGQLSQKASLH